MIQGSGLCSALWADDHEDAGISVSGGTRDFARGQVLSFDEPPRHGRCVKDHGF